MFLHQKYQTRSVTTLHSCSEIEDRFSTVRKTRTLSYQQTEAITRIHQLLARKVRNKKCYCFQVLKQFFIFPDSSCSSSCLSLSRYDPLIFTDQALHSLLKIMETQLIQRKIWAFINLKMNKKQYQVKQLIQKSDNVIKKISVFQKEQSFRLIKQIGTRAQRSAHLSKQLVYNLTFNHSPGYLEVGEKSSKIQHNISKRTVESERDGQSAMKSHFQARSVMENYCRGCNCYSYCCCCSANMGYNLQQRIQYLRRLEQMVQMKERNALYR